MSAVSRKLRHFGSDILAFHCPGCGYPHCVEVGAGEGPRWSWNGSIDAPTFAPSILVTAGHCVDGQPQPPHCQHCIEAASDGRPSGCSRCHSFVTDGRIQFLADSTHALAGQTVDIPDWETRHGS